MSSPHSPGQNHILAALPPAEFDTSPPDLQPVAMRRGELGTGNRRLRVLRLVKKELTRLLHDVRYRPAPSALAA
jgi:hypothetical protein